MVPAPDGSFTAAGVTWTDVTVVPGVRPAMRTTLSRAPLQWVEEGRFGPANARLALTFTACPEGTRVSADFTVTALRAGRAITLASRRTVAADLRRAARILGATR